MEPSEQEIWLNSHTKIKFIASAVFCDTFTLSLQRSYLLCAVQFFWCKFREINIGSTSNPNVLISCLLDNVMIL